MYTLGVPTFKRTRNLAASGLSCSPPVWVVGQGAICRTRGHFVGQGDIFVGQGDIFVGQGDILSDKGTFLSDKGTFFVGQGDI